ncbi:MAG: cytochrome d ubiquinol oxidase subunit II [Pseudomonadota bacterium]
MPGLDLPFVWAGLIAFAVLAYVLLDGFDLGVGLLFPLLKSKRQRDAAMNSVAPVWDGNETWLILGGGGLYAAFPLAYAVLLTALYAPIIAMLIGLVLRGVAFEYRWRTERGRWMWDFAFTFGSLTAAFSQGLTLGALVDGIAIEGRAYAGGWWDWLSPLSVVTGIALVVGYAALGATWLVMKGTEDLEQRARQLATWLCPALLVCIGLISAWMLLMRPEFNARWFAGASIHYVAPVPVLTVMVGLGLLQGLRSGQHVGPFLGTMLLFVLSFIGLAISFYPNLLPPDLSFRAAAAPDKSLSFLLVGAAVLIPLILLYTSYSYWVFRGKVAPDDGYH